MDISKETNQDKLKALAYDQMAQIEQSQANLRAINQRIAQVQEEAQTAGETKPQKDK